MKTFSFIGSDKNAGKTTVLNFVYKRLWEKHGEETPVCLTSIGINGEEIDAYEGHPKPRIRVFKSSFFVTAGEHLKELTGKYEVFDTFSNFNKLYILGKCLSDFQVVLEGPNNKQELAELKKIVNVIIPRTCLLIDGSIDRQFLAHPDISDAFYFALLVSDRKEQIQKAKDLLFSLTFSACSKDLKTELEKIRRQDTKSVLLDKESQVLYHGNEIPSFDANLKNICMKYKNKDSILYLNGALSKSLFTFFAPFKKLEIILDNFTLYQNVSVRESHGTRFAPEILLLHCVRINKIFLKQENLAYNKTGNTGSLGIPRNVPVHNLFRENPYEIGI
ncbi:MAG: hypothetical protein GY749_49785 [Desulfobacteraceae bacterium]|nr:hypothetical protein [Desulfobacteraceae bacterium]